MRIGQLVCDFQRIVELDVNPLIAGPAAVGNAVADVRIRLWMRSVVWHCLTAAGKTPCLGKTSFRQRSSSATRPPMPGLPKSRNFGSLTRIFQPGGASYG